MLILYLNLFFFELEVKALSKLNKNRLIQSNWRAIFWNILFWVMHIMMCEADNSYWYFCRILFHQQRMQLAKSRILPKKRRKFYGKNVFFSISWWCAKITTCTAISNPFNCTEIDHFMVNLDFDHYCCLLEEKQDQLL